MAVPDLLHAVSRLEPADRVLAVTSERLDLTARAFARIIDAKSPFTYRPSERVAETATAMAEHMALPTYAVRDQGRAGLLHDIGKLAVSNLILDKPGPLTHAGYAQVKQHPRLTYDTLVRLAPFRGIAEVAASHHEKLDGSGYHRGVTAQDLSLPSRILAVADVFDALSQDRPYRPAMLAALTRTGLLNNMRYEERRKRILLETRGSSGGIGEADVR